MLEKTERKNPLGYDALLVAASGDSLAWIGVVHVVFGGLLALLLAAAATTVATTTCTAAVFVRILCQWRNGAAGLLGGEGTYSRCALLATVSLPVAGRPG